MPSLFLAVLTAGAGCVVRASVPSGKVHDAAACIDPGALDVSADPASARSLAPSSTTRACTTRGDEDAFVVVAPPGSGGTLIRYRLRGAHEMAPRLELLDRDRALLLRESAASGATAQGWIHLAAGAPMYLRVSQNHGVDETYTLDLVATALDEQGEPNASAETATPIAIGRPHPALMGNAAGDRDALVDWYQFDASGDGALTVDVEMSDAIGARVELFDENRRRRALKSGGRGDRIRLEVNARRGERFFLQVSSVYTVERAGRGEVPTRLQKPYFVTVAPVHGATSALTAPR
jgi:hypothetical protein